MFCVRCGTRLEQGKCPNCGFVDNFDDKPKVVSSPSAKPDEKKSKIKKTKVKKPKEKKFNNSRSKEIKPEDGKLKALLSKEKAQEKRTLTKKRKKVIIIIAAAMAVVLGVGAFLTVYFIKDAKYQEAISYLDNNKPETAKQEFEELKSFKDSEQYLEDCNTLIAYYDAVDTYENEDYEDALDKFEELGSYKDSEDYAELSQNYIDYNGAKAYFDAGNFEQAKTVFVALGDFEDSINMATSCQSNMDYNEAQTLYNAKDYEGAKRLFVGIPDFKDSEDMAFICECLIDYEDAMGAYSKGSYSSAAGLFKNLESKIKLSKIDLTGILEQNQLKYYQGQCFYKQDLFYSAYQAFSSAGGYEDANMMLSQCRKTFKTEEIYINPSYTRNSVKFTFYGKDASQDACVKIYDGSTLVSICLIKKGEKLKIYLPSGTFDMEVSYGYNWYGEKEAFGTSPSARYSDKLHSDYYYWIDL